MSGSVERKKTQRSFLKEKVLQIYDKLFQDITQGRADFWDDFFLLKTNVKWLHSHFEKTSIDDVGLLKHQLNRLILQCIYTARHEKHRIRVANAIQTMDALVCGIYRCKGVSDFTGDPSTLLFNDDQIGEFMQQYVSLCSEVFREDRPERLRSLVFNSMHTLATASSNFRKNPFALGLMNEHIFDLLRLTLVNAQLRYAHGLAACKLLGILTQFARYEIGEAFTSDFCLTDDELLLNGISSTVSLALSEYNVLFRQQHDPSVGIISSVSSFFGQLFSGDLASNVRLRPCDSLLMCMYAITKNGTHFSTILSYSTGYCETASTFDGLSAAGSLRDEKFRTFSSDSIYGFMTTSSLNALGRIVPVGPQDPARSRKTSSMNEQLYSLGTKGSLPELRDSDVCDADPPDFVILPSPSDGHTLNGSSDGDAQADDSINAALEPRNLLADLLEYCSIVMQDVKSRDALNSCQLCFIIILCITQNPLACSILHDHHVTFKVWIHKPRSRYRKHNTSACPNFSSRPIAIAILSLMVEFMRGHLMKHLPHRLYSIACSICRNLICFQAKHKIRLDFDWKQLWSVLLTLIQFVLNLDVTSTSPDIGFNLIHKALEIFNLCILHGDSFLQSADVYDDLYYELIRMHRLVENLYEHGLAHASGQNLEIKPIASSVVLQLGNIRSIVNHFNAKIAAFSSTNNLTSLTEDQVLSVVRENYDSLNLRILDDLDVPDFYVEDVDNEFFVCVLDTVLKQSRKECVETSFELQSHLQELSVIH